jgi:hypothetical protein
VSPGVPSSAGQRSRKPEIPELDEPQRGGFRTSDVNPLAVREGHRDFASRKTMRMDGLEGGAHDSARCRHDGGAQLECTCGSSRRRIEEDGGVEEEGRNRGLQRTPCSSVEILGSRRGSLPSGRRWPKAGRILGLALLSALLCPTVSSMGGSSAAPLRGATSAAGTKRPTSCSPSPICFRGAPGQEVEGWAGVMGKVSREFEGARESIRKKRLEIEYEEASQLEEAFAHSQIWINPLQGWNQMQRAVDLAAKDSAFVKSPLWPVTAFLLVKVSFSPCPDPPPDPLPVSHPRSRSSRSRSK